MRISGASCGEKMGADGHRVHRSPLRQLRRSHRPAAGGPAMLREPATGLPGPPAGSGAGSLPAGETPPHGRAPAAAGRPETRRPETGPPETERDLAERDLAGRGRAERDQTAQDEAAWLAGLAARLGIAVAAPQMLEAAVRRMEAEAARPPVPPPLLVLGHGPEGPLYALTATPATAGRLAALLAASPALRRRARLVSPQALAAAFARLEIRPASHRLAEYHALPGDVDDALAGLVALNGNLIARRPVTRGQAGLLAAALAGVVAALATVPDIVFGALSVAVATGFLMLAAARRSAARLVAAGGFHPPLAPVPDDAELPVYTVLVPLRHEAAVVPRLIVHLLRLDYPPDRLDIKLLVDADDTETAAAVRCHARGAMFELVVVPRRGPLTKPKVLDIGLQNARGSLVTVFDAEDRPQPGQLREAAAAFAAGGADLGCVQARLSVDHGGEKLITGFFALEYAMLFDGLLPFYASRGLPFLLGGTSNHFRRSALRAIGGWDAWNVTEDADLAIRLARAGFRFTVIGSATFEEAPLTVGAFLRQRGRWQKGWLQTWLVHMRAPRALFRALGARAFVTLQLQFFGGLFASLALALWGGLLLAGLAGLPVALSDGSLAGDVLFALGVADCLVCYGAAGVLAVRALAARPIGVSRWLIALWPVYGGLLAFSAVRAVWEWLRRPHHWDKTAHGLARHRPEAAGRGRRRGSARRQTGVWMRTFRFLPRAGS